MNTPRKKIIGKVFLGIVLILVLLAGAGWFILQNPQILRTQLNWGYDREVPEAEKHLRQQVIATAEDWLGCKEEDGSHIPILDIYNAHKPLARGYAIKPEDSWCCAFVSAVSIQNRLTEIIPTEVGCEKQIELFQEIDSWVEEDDYVPLPGDLIFYCWDRCPGRACTCFSRHVGIVVGTWNGLILSIEGNWKDAVTYHCVRVNDPSIRGFAVPDYGSKAR